jgi:hypothetical protein
LGYIQTHHKQRKKIMLLRACLMLMLACSPIMRHVAVWVVDGQKPCFMLSNQFPTSMKTKSPEKGYNLIQALKQ